ncbi:flagellar protein FlaG [Pseudoduganella danionis]|uniref:flagellar protein FlaG n=1 Tax=Pseudoduganella danionis TaxID=1890295 RepID=UPI0035B3C4B6
MNLTPITSPTGQTRTSDVKAAEPSHASAQAAPAENTPPATAAPVTLDKNQLKNSVDAINRYLKDNSEVQFSIDDSSGASVIKVVDTETKKILRQFPSQQALDISKDLQSKTGLLLKGEA